MIRLLAALAMGIVAFILQVGGGHAAPALKSPPPSAIAGTTWTGTYLYPNNPTGTPVTVTFTKDGKVIFSYRGDAPAGTWKLNPDKSLEVVSEKMILTLNRQGSDLVGTSQEQGANTQVQWSLEKSK